MFVTNHDSTDKRRNRGVALKQRRGGNETLVQWNNGDCRWVPTKSLQENPNGVKDTTGEVFNNG